MKRHIFIFTVIVFLCGSSGVFSADQVEVDLCHSSVRYTELKSEKYNLKIFNPDNLTHPEIWQGPVCVTDISSNKQCGVELSLIKSVKILPDSKIFIVEVFSGSNAETVKVSLENCKIEKRGRR